MLLYVEELSGADEQNEIFALFFGYYGVLRRNVQIC